MHDQAELQRDRDQVESELDQRELRLVNHLINQRERKLQQDRQLQRDLERRREAAAPRSALLSAAATGGRGDAAAPAAAIAAPAASAAITAATASYYQDAARRAHMIPSRSTLPAVADPPLLQRMVRWMVPGYHPAATSATPPRAGAATMAASAALATSDMGQRVDLSGEKFWFAALRGETAVRELAPPPHAAAPTEATGPCWKGPCWPSPSPRMEARALVAGRTAAAKFLPAKSPPAKSPPAKSALSAVARGVRKPTLGAGTFTTLQRPVLGGAAALSRAAVLPGAMATTPLRRLAITELLQRSAPPPQGAPQAVGEPLLQQHSSRAKGAPPPLPRAPEAMPGLESSESLELNHQAPPLQLPTTSPVTQSPALPSTPGPESPTTVMSSPDNVPPLLLKPSAPPHALHPKLAGRPPLRFAPAPERTDKLKCFCVGDADGAVPPPHSKRRTTCASSAVGEGGSENAGGAGAEEASPRAVKRACLSSTVSSTSLPLPLILTLTLTLTMQMTSFNSNPDPSQVSLIHGDVINMPPSPPHALHVKPLAAAPAHPTSLQDFGHFVLKCQDTGKLPELVGSPDSPDTPDTPDSETALDSDEVESEEGRFEPDCEELDSSDYYELEAVARSRRNLSAVSLQRPPCTGDSLATHRLPGAPVGAPGAPLRPLAITRRRASGPHRCMQAADPRINVPVFAPQLATQL